MFISLLNKIWIDVFTKKYLSPHSVCKSASIRVLLSHSHFFPTTSQLIQNWSQTAADARIPPLQKSRIFRVCLSAQRVHRCLFLPILFSWHCFELVNMDSLKFAFLSLTIHVYLCQIEWNLQVFSLKTDIMSLPSWSHCDYVSIQNNSIYTKGSFCSFFWGLMWLIGLECKRKRRNKFIVFTSIQIKSFPQHLYTFRHYLKNSSIMVEAHKNIIVAVNVSYYLSMMHSCSWHLLGVITPHDLLHVGWV